MWRQHVLQFCPAARFGAPLADEDLVAAESALGIRLEDQLRSCLNETDGISGDYELPLLWSIDRIVDDNRHFRNEPAFRELYMPFDCLLFFADAGNGDQFAYPITAGAIRRPDVFVWNHETDSRLWVAPSLKTYLEWWLSGRIEV
jgi:hypothetical protein